MKKNTFWMVTLSTFPFAYLGAILFWGFCGVLLDIPPPPEAVLKVVGWILDPLPINQNMDVGDSFVIIIMLVVIWPFTCIIHWLWFEFIFGFDKQWPWKLSKKTNRTVVGFLWRNAYLPLAWLGFLYSITILIAFIR